MKLATYKDGSRDGQLVVVSRDLGLAHYASHIANRLQQVLDDWNYLSPQLQDVFDALNAGRARHAFAFDPSRCMAPLPRARVWAEGVAYTHHAQLMHRASGADGAEPGNNTPAMTHLGADGLQGAHDPITGLSEAFGIDFGAGLAAVTGDIPQACAPDRALDGVRLLMLYNGVCLRQLMPTPWATTPVGVHSRPLTAFSPVAVTPDELGDAWARGRIHLPLQTTWNGRKSGMCEAGPEMGFHFGQLIAHLATTRSLGAGTIVGSGVVSNKGVEKKSGSNWPKGYNCIAEKRAMEVLQDGKATTAFMKAGDTIRIEMKNAAGQSVFGAIEQEVVPADGVPA